MLSRNVSVAVLVPAVWAHSFGADTAEDSSLTAILQFRDWH